MKTAFMIVAMFLVTQLLGLYVGSQMLVDIEAGVIQTFVEPESVFSSFMLFTYVIIMTAVILIAVKFWKPSIRILEAFVVFISSWIAFDYLIPIGLWYVSLGLILAVALTIWKVFRPSILSQNVAAILSGAGAGALFGASFGFLPALIFLVLLCAYDFVSVFITRHMIHLAKELTKIPMAFTIASPHKFKRAKFIGPKGRKKRKKIHVFQLGVGDIVIPMMFSISLLRDFTIIDSLITIGGSTMALLLLIYYISKKPSPLPALPFITVGTLAGFVISVFI